MKLNVIEQSKEKLKLEVPNITFVNLLNDKIWGAGADYTAYNIDHPYLSKPVLVVKSKNPKRTLLSAAENIIADIKELRKLLQHAVK